MKFYYLYYLEQIYCFWYIYNSANLKSMSILLTQVNGIHWISPNKIYSYILPLRTIWITSRQALISIRKWSQTLDFAYKNVDIYKYHCLWALLPASMPAYKWNDIDSEDSYKPNPNCSSIALHHVLKGSDIDSEDSCSWSRVASRLMRPRCIPIPCMLKLSVMDNGNSYKRP